MKRNPAWPCRPGLPVAPCRLSRIGPPRRPEVLRNTSSFGSEQSHRTYVADHGGGGASFRVLREKVGWGGGVLVRNHSVNNLGWIAMLVSSWKSSFAAYGISTVRTSACLVSKHDPIGPPPCSDGTASAAQTSRTCCRSEDGTLSDQGFFRKPKLVRDPEQPLFQECGRAVRDHAVSLHLAETAASVAPAALGRLPDLLSFRTTQKDRPSSASARGTASGSCRRPCA